MLLPHQWHGAGEPVVLIAGLGAKGTSWRPFLDRAAQGFRVLTFDNPGSGASPPLEGPIRLRDMASAALELLDALGVARAAVVGRSMGGMIAQELALLAPDRVSRLVLASTTGHADAHLAEVFRLWARQAEEGVPAHIRHRSSLLWCLGRDSLDNDARVRGYLEARARADRPADYALQARACAGHRALERLASVSVPTLVLAGTDDRLTPPFHAEALAGAIPGAKLCYIRGAGHLAHLEAPDCFAACVLGFLQPGSDEETACPSATTP